MPASPWIELIKQIPYEKHNQLSLVTQSGTEIVIQAIFVAEGENLVFKGRMSGSQDTGRAFFIPFAQIDYVCTLQPVPEDQLKEWFNVQHMPGEEEPEKNKKTKAKDKDSKPDAEAKTEEGRRDPLNGGSGLHQLNARQTALLEKVRSRGSGANGESQ